MHCMYCCFTTCVIPAYIWTGPIEKNASSCKVATTNLPIMRRSTSPTPVGRGHSFLSSGIDLFARNVSKLLDEIFCVQSFILIRLAVAVHKSVSLPQNCLIVKLVSNHSVHS